jgi:L-alanine-DL-glutamate epimerase-like enolase superfamily enzyme
MKITHIETYSRGPLLSVVRVRTDDGHEGWGQTATYYADVTTTMLHSYVAPFFIGKDPWNWEALVDEFTMKMHKVYGSILWRALCGIDTAVYDLLAKSVGRPVYQLLGGGVRTRIPVYGSSMSRKTTPEEEADRMLKLREEHGFEAFKIRIGNVMGRDTEPVRGRSVALVKTVRETLGSDVTLHADANGGYSAPEAIRIGRLLEEQGFGHFEEPCVYTDLESTAHVAAVLDIPVAAGEQESSLPQFQRMIDARSVDIVQPDIGYIGGVARARKVMQMAEAKGMTAAPHTANPSLLQVFTMHLVASQPSASGYQEWGIEAFPYFQEIFTPMPEVRNGHVELTDRPGWGVEVLPSFLESSQHNVTDSARTR